jgi:hypothetical protein
MKWVNQFQPQTLYMATILCYIDAVFGFIFPFGTSRLTAYAVVLLLAAGGFGIANEKKWGYALGLLGAVLNLVWPLLYGLGLSWYFGSNIINTIFSVALVALLLHPMSRDYQRIWFR